MAQEPDYVTGDALSERDASTDDYTPDAQRDPSEIERDIERTRAEMSETIDAIGARFQPEYIKEQAKEALRDTARSAGTSMFDTIRDNPLPAAIAGMSIAWLFANASSGSRRNDGDYRYAGYDRGRGYGPGPGYDRYGSYGPYDRDASGEASLRDRAGEATSDVRDRASDVLDSARARASDLGDRVAGEAQHLQQQAEQTGQRAMTWLEDQMDRNPLGVGAVALAAGALVGLSLPTTDAEQNLFGEPAQQLKSRVEDAAHETLDKAKEVASSVASEAKEKAGEVVESAKEKAGEVADAAKNQAHDVAETAQSEAKRVATTATSGSISGSGASSSGAASSGLSGTAGSGSGATASTGSVSDDAKTSGAASDTTEHIANANHPAAGDPLANPAERGTS